MPPLGDTSKHSTSGSRRSIEQIWARYADGNTMQVEGTIQYVQDLGLSLEDPAVLALAYELKSPEVGVFVKDGFISGWSSYACATIGDMAACVRQWSRIIEHAFKDKNPDMNDPANSYFAKIYRFTFKYLLSDGQRLLSREDAVAYWNLLLVPKFPIANAWVDFINQRGYNVNSDTWNMTLNFCVYALKDPSLEHYDYEYAWPAVMDEFIDSRISDCSNIKKQ